MMSSIGEIVLVLVMVLAIIGNYYVLFNKIKKGPIPPFKSDVGMLWGTSAIGILCGIALTEIIGILLFTALLAIEMADVLNMRKVKTPIIKRCTENNN